MLEPKQDDKESIHRTVAVGRQPKQDKGAVHMGTWSCMGS